MTFKEKIKQDFPKEWETLLGYEAILDAGNYPTMGTLSKVLSIKAKIFDKLMEADNE